MSWTFVFSIFNSTFDDDQNFVTCRVLKSIIFFTVAFCSKRNAVSCSRFSVNGIALMAP
jgi:hypothetical protein